MLISVGSVAENIYDNFCFKLFISDWMISGIIEDKFVRSYKFLYIYMCFESMFKMLIETCIQSIIFSSMKWTRNERTCPCNTVVMCFNGIIFLIYYYKIFTFECYSLLSHYIFVYRIHYFKIYTFIENEIMLANNNC